MKYIFISLSLSILLSGVSVMAEQLHVKPGLWETTTATEKKRAKQPTNLDKLTKEQRDRVEKKLAESTRKETSTVQSCLKEEQIRTSEAFIGKTHRDSCKREIKNLSATGLLATVDCRGANIMTGSISIHASDPEHFSGSVDMIYGEAGGLQLQTKSEISGRWLQGDCGKSDNRR